MVFPINSSLFHFFPPIGIRRKRYRYVVPKYGSRLIKKSWFLARKHCISLGGDLASIGNRDEQSKIVMVVTDFRTSNFWIGANDIKKEGQFQWSDGSLFSFTFWWSGEPNNKGSRGPEDCVQLKGSRYGRAWNDLACSFRNPFICKISY